LHDYTKMHNPLRNVNENYVKSQIILLKWIDRWKLS